MPKMTTLRSKLPQLRSSVAQAPGSSTPRKRGRALQAQRARWFAAHPLCVECERQGIAASAVELDHMLALVNGGSDVDANLQGLCKSCHAQKTRRDLGHNPSRPPTVLDGWPK